MSVSQTPVGQILRQTTALLGIVFARKSPERLSYSRRNLIVSVFVALFAAYFAHTRFLGLDTPHALVKLVFELGILVVGLNLAWRSSADRQRLLRMTMTLFLISAAGDVVLILLSLVPLESSLGPSRQAIAYATMLAMIAGAVNVLQYALGVSWRIGGAYALGYVALSLLFYDLTRLFL